MEVHIEVSDEGGTEYYLQDNEGEQNSVNYCNLLLHQWYTPG